METSITRGIKITVTPTYQPEQSQPEEDKFIFSYEVLIENKSEFTVQLLRRHWYIFDSVGAKREVEGPGVIGEQPVLAPGEKFKYKSWCPLLSQMGCMKGTFLMVRKDNNERFDVTVPQFQMICPIVFN